MANETILTEAKALVILGERRFLSADRVVAGWNKIIAEHRTNHLVPPLKLSGSPAIKYTEETLKGIASDPAWRLIYDPGFSLRDARPILGTDPTHQPCHLQGNDWWLAQREETWATMRTEQAYYLIRTEGLFPCDNPAKDWDWQEEQVRQMGEIFHRAPTHIIANSCISCCLITDERLLENYYNFGPEIDADYCFLVTKFDQTGLNFGHWLRNDWGGYWGADLQVCLTRKFDV